MRRPGSRPDVGGPPGAVAVLWTGGKDCTLALHESIALGHDVRTLVTFVPRRGEFRAHPLAVMRLQAESLGLAWWTIPVSPPFKRGYEDAIHRLRASGIETLVTGDIDRVGDCSNWIRDRASVSGVGVRTPLWERSREALLGAIHRERISALVSYVRDPPLDRRWLGRALGPRACHDLLRCGRAAGFDPCGEQGEYHTIVVDSPLFDRRVELRLGPAVPRPRAWQLSITGARLAPRTRRGPSGEQGVPGPSVTGRARRIPRGRGYKLDGPKAALSHLAGSSPRSSRRELSPPRERATEPYRGGVQGAEGSPGDLDQAGVGPE